jgi:large subunit ribosomal protein L18
VIRAKNPANNRLRLSIFRSSQHIYAQVIDDTKGHTVAAASSLEKDLKLKTGADMEAAKAVGAAIAQRAKAAGIAQVVFDRSGYLYHGRVKALADGAREAGLEF